MMNKITDVVKHLIIINVILFIVTFYLKLEVGNYLPQYFIENQNFKIWQYLTSVFFHWDFKHLLFNMLGLWFFGSPLEEIWGKTKFIFFYLSCGIGASIISSLVHQFQFNNALNELLNLGYIKSDIFNNVNSSLVYTNIHMQKINSLMNTVSGGASGALYGVMVAFAIKYPKAKMGIIFLPIMIETRIFVPLLLISDLFFGVFSIPGDNVGRFAHIGGAIVGYLIISFWKKNQFTRWN